jgi:hypothetical protein
MTEVLAAVVATDVFLSEWYRNRNTVGQLEHLINLMRLNRLGSCHERFMFVEEGLEPGLYVCRNEFGSGFVMYAFFGKRASSYMLNLFSTEAEAERVLAGPVSRLAIRTHCERIFNEWVTVR